MGLIRRALGLTIIATFAMASFASVADAKDRHKRKHRVKVYSIDLHAVPVTEGRRAGRVQVYWLGPYGVVAARGGGTIIGGAFAFDDAGSPARAGGQALTMGAPETIARLCEQEAAGSPDQTTARLARTVDATQAQRNALEELRSTMAEAARFLRESCPTDVPLDPVTRFSVLQRQIDSMRRAVEMLKPPLARFEQSLSEQQRARLSTAQAQPEPQAIEQQAGGEICQATAAITRLPVERIARTVRPRGEQREALRDALQASIRAAEMLAQTCRQPAPATPLARLEGMEHQLQAAAEAVQTVNAATRDFYDSLWPEQKARFDRMNSRHAMRPDRTSD
jgi:hypothetical protein